MSGIKLMLYESIGKGIPTKAGAHGGKFRPFAKACERGWWGELDVQTAGSLIEAGEPYLGKTWPVMTATRYMDFHRTGARFNAPGETLSYETMSSQRRSALSALVLAECTEYKGRFMDDIVDLIWCICEETTWCIPAHKAAALNDPDNPLRNKEPAIELFSAQTGAMLSCVHYLLEDELSAVSRFIPERIEDEIKTRILDNYLERDDYFWMAIQNPTYLNNWCPWISSSCLCCFLLLERDAHRLTKAIYKASKGIDAFIDSYGEDGGCDEGPGYWRVAGEALFDCLELLYLATEGRVTLYGNEKIRRIFQYTYKMYIGGRCSVNFADGGPYAACEPGKAFLIGKRIEDERMTAYAKSLYMEETGPAQGDARIYRKMWSLDARQSLKSVTASGSFYLRDHWFNDIQVMTARQAGGSPNGFFIAAKGGHNGDNHNHNDVGHFILYYDAKPIIIDLGVESYSRKTFGAQRYDIWTMQSSYHSLPEINGCQQKDGREFAAADVAYAVEGNRTSLTMSLKGAYPRESAIGMWVRNIVFDRGGAMIGIYDKYKLPEDKGCVTFNFMTSLKPLELPGGRLDFGKVYMEYPGEVASFGCEEYPCEDENLKKSWGEKVYRLRFPIEKAGTEGEFYVRFIGA